MATQSKPDLSRLQWKPYGEYQWATDGSRFYMRESNGSMIAAAIFCAAIVLSSGWLGIHVLITPYTLMEKAFGVLMLIVAAVFTYIPWLTLRTGRRMILFDRGEPGRSGEIRLNEKSLAADTVRAISTRPAGGSPARYVLVAELHDGRVETLGFCSVSTWPAHYAQQAAAWMGLPVR